eukprot:CAMPEP_0197844692 /NCGR_PEP_ID=MMETSP1438-20131217/1679_1 /TAXON_ID=1461541 /ORGANISM="Pterosperma sp., Strain CCMP1384" /LENGTH=93 /DNA_ID=CAMNT_0043455629 /DNA_START=151 /DNA_END=432 /DNA_ORIENTATION=+
MRGTWVPTLPRPGGDLKHTSTKSASMLLGDRLHSVHCTASQGHLNYKTQYGNSRSNPVNEVHQPRYPCNNICSTVSTVCFPYASQGGPRTYLN